jgi:ABC-type oligopeptide transport system ATPase subunit
MDRIIAEQRELIKKADYDHKNCDKEYSANLQRACKEKYEALLSRATAEEKPALEAEYKNEMRKAKKTKLVTQIQMIFQDPIASLDPRMTVKEIISEGLVIQGERDKKVIEEKVFQMLELVGLVREHASRYPHEFSGGQRQRIGVARAVIMNPELIIADEPVSALDVSVQAQVINLLNELRQRLGLTILFIAHDLSVVKYFSDRIGVMYFGKMVELADADELFAHPMHPYTRSLLSAIPLPDPIYEKNRQRIAYNPLASHDYTVDKPTMREIIPGHFVHCNDAEEKRYKEEFGL